MMGGPKKVMRRCVVEKRDRKKITWECETMVPAPHIFCQIHWGKIPKELRVTIFDLVGTGIPYAPGSKNRLMFAVGQAVKHLIGSPVVQEEEPESSYKNDAEEPDFGTTPESEDDHEPA